MKELVGYNCQILTKYSEDESLWSLFEIVIGNDVCLLERYWRGKEICNL